MNTNDYQPAPDAAKGEDVVDHLRVMARLAPKVRGTYLEAADEILRLRTAVRTAEGERDFYKKLHEDACENETRAEKVLEEFIGGPEYQPLYELAELAVNALRASEQRRGELEAALRHIREESAKDGFGCMVRYIDAALTPPVSQASTPTPGTDTATGGNTASQGAGEGGSNG